MNLLLPCLLLIISLSIVSANSSNCFKKGCFKKGCARMGRPIKVFNGVATVEECQKKCQLPEWEKCKAFVWNEGNKKCRLKSHSFDTRRSVKDKKKIAGPKSCMQQEEATAEHDCFKVGFGARGTKVGKNKNVGKNKAEACQIRCENHPDCTVWVYRHYGECIMKKGSTIEAEYVKKTGRITKTAGPKTCPSKKQNEVVEVSEHDCFKVGFGVPGTKVGKNKNVGRNNAEACQIRCENHGDCKVWVYRRSGLCIMKKGSTIEDVVQNRGTITKTAGPRKCKCDYDSKTYPTGNCADNKDKGLCVQEKSNKLAKVMFDNCKKTCGFPC